MHILLVNKGSHTNYHFLLLPWCIIIHLILLFLIYGIPLLLVRGLVGITFHLWMFVVYLHGCFSLKKIKLFVVLCYFRNWGKFNLAKI